MFFITGASGSGKSASLPGLRAALPTVDRRDFDEFGVPSPCPRGWRPLTTERWIQVATEISNAAKIRVSSAAPLWGKFWLVRQRPALAKFTLLSLIATTSSAWIAFESVERTERHKIWSRGQPGSACTPSIRGGGRM